MTTSKGAARGSTEKIPRDHFRCDSCGEVFPKAWSDAEALAEKEELWGEGPIPGGEAVVCDDCFRALMGETPAERDKTAAAVRTMVNDLAPDCEASKASAPKGAP